MSCPALFGQQINIAGSDTPILLGQRLAQQYKRHSPDTRISVRVGGSEPAISNLGAGIDIVQDETASVNAPIHVAVGVRGIAIYVNKIKGIR